MRESDAAKQTKYFAEGVSVGIWCYAGDGNWSLNIDRDGHVQFLGIDALKRAAQHVHRQVRENRPEIELFEPRSYPYPELIVNFQSRDEALACLRTIAEAVAYIQQRTTDPDWFSVADDVFTATGQIQQDKR